MIDGLAIQVLMNDTAFTPTRMHDVCRDVAAKLIGFALEPAPAGVTRSAPLGASGPDPLACAAMAPIPLILDVDTGVDDALAILYALASPEVTLIGATTVMGNVDLDHTT